MAKIYILNKVYTSENSTLQDGQVEFFPIGAGSKEAVEKELKGYMYPKKLKSKVEEVTSILAGYFLRVVKVTIQDSISIYAISQTTQL